MDEQTINRYLAYFREQVESAPGLGPDDMRARIDNILMLVRQHLADGGYPADVVSSEMALATDAAQVLRGDIAKRLGTGMVPSASPEASAATPPPAQPAAKSALPAFMATRHGKISAGLAVLAVLAYLIPLALFLSESKARRAPHVPVAGELALEISMASVDLVKDTATINIQPDAGIGMNADGQLQSDLALEVDAGNGVQSYTFKAKIPLSPWTLTLPLEDGDILDYPFDRHLLAVDLSAKENGRNIAVSTYPRQAAHGYRFTQADVSAGESYHAEFVIAHSGTIIFIALLTTLSLMMVTFAALAVAFQVTKGRRRADFSMMTWVGALLFVIPSVRSGLPGQVPAGALIDFAVYFWLQALTAFAAAALVYAWLRQKA